MANHEELGVEREVWVHEKCAIWAPGIYLAGPHLVGLAEAVAASTVTVRIIYKLTNLSESIF